MDHPTLLPDPSGQGLEQVGRIALEALTKEGAVVIGQGMDVDEELGTTGNPLALIGRDLLGGFVEVLAQLPDAGQVGLLGAGQQREQTQVACLPKPRRRQVGEAD